MFGTRPAEFRRHRARRHRAAATGRARMTPQERDLITQLLRRLAQAGGQPKDPEADALIRQALAAQPDAPYYLVQTVLIQDMALSNAQARIQALEQQLAQQATEAKPAAAQPTSFLGGLFGG